LHRLRQLAPALFRRFSSPVRFDSGQAAAQSTEKLAASPFVFQAL
jgi:hypothetical protein